MYLSTFPVGYSGSKPTVTKKITNCNKKRIPHVVEKKCHILFCSGEIDSSTCSRDLGVDDFSYKQQLANRIEVSLAHFCLVLFKVQNHCPCYLPFLWSETICVVFFCKFVQFFALILSIRLRVVIRHKSLRNPS